MKLKKLQDYEHQIQHLKDKNIVVSDCAHYSRLYYWIFTALPKMPTDNSYIPTRRLFAQLYVLKMMYPEHKKWNENVLKPLIKLVKKYDEYISKSHLDFPYRWKSMLKWNDI